MLSDHGSSYSYFEDNELVWGKSDGCTWWPGILTVLDQENGRFKYRVDF